MKEKKNNIMEEGKVNYTLPSCEFKEENEVIEVKDNNNNNKNKKKRRKKKKKSNWPFYIVFLIGFLILMYPKISDFYYKVESKTQVADFSKEKDLIPTEDIKKRMELARIYNETLNNKITKDPYINKDTIEDARREYARMLEVKEKIGFIQIPTLNLELPIYAGTSEEVLQKGVGHLEGTSLPIGGNSTHTVLPAHAGLPKTELFTNINKLKVGDKFYIHNIAETLAYQVDDIVVIDPGDFSKLTVVPGHDYVTLLTCTPVPVNSHRLLVRGHRVEYVKEVDERIIADNKISFTYKYLFYLAIGVVVVLLLILINLLINYFKLKRETVRESLEETNLALENKENEKHNEKENNKVDNRDNHDE